MTLGNGNQPTHKFKLCNKCNEHKPPEGGIQLNHTKWHCQTCWIGRVNNGNLKRK